MAKKNKKWNDYLWIATISYFTLGLFNIVFGWLGLICFITPLVISISTGSKAYCNKYCGRSQLLNILGTKFKLSNNKPLPKFLRSNYFRYGFLSFFMIMFSIMLFNTYLVFNGTNSLREVLTILWTFKLPWKLYNLTNVTPWIAQFAFGFYSMMLTSTIIGIVSMIFFKPRAWCVYCPIGTMTQGICIVKDKVESKK